MTTDEMMVHDLRIFVQPVPWDYNVEVLIAGTNVRTGKRAYVPKLDWIEVVEPGLSYGPTLRLTMETSQILMDDLWKCGLRPSEGTGSAGSLKATENHLKDMQQLVWKLIPKALRNEKD